MPYFVVDNNATLRVRVENLLSHVDFSLAAKNFFLNNRILLPNFRGLDNPWPKFYETYKARLDSFASKPGGNLYLGHFVRDFYKDLECDYFSYLQEMSEPEIRALQQGSGSQTSSSSVGSQQELENNKIARLMYVIKSLEFYMLQLVEKDKKLPGRMRGLGSITDAFDEQPEPVTQELDGAGSTRTQPPRFAHFNLGHNKVIIMTPEEDDQQKPAKPRLRRQSARYE